MSADAVTATCVAIPEKGDEELMEFSRVPRENNAMMEDKRSWKEAEEGNISSRDTSTKVDTRNLQTVDIVADFIRNLFPSNIVRAAISQSQTKYKEVQTLSVVNVSGVMTNVTDTVLVKSLGMTSTTNLLGLIIICAALGIAASQLGRKSEPMVAFFRAGASVIFKLFDWIKWSSPVGVASLIARALISIDDLAEGFTSMGLFLLATMVGGLVYQLVFLTGLYLLLIRRNPITFLLSLARPWLISVGPPSSLIVYPEIMEIAIHKYKVDPRVPGFVLPFCTTLNRDGSCCFIVTTCLFVAQFAGAELTASLCLLTGLLSILSSLAIPSVPSASVVAVLLILGSLGIPPVNIGLILAVEWMTDRLRTTTNAVSHMLAVLVTWEFTKKHLQGKTKDEEQPILTDAVQSTSPKNNL